MRRTRGRQSGFRTLHEYRGADQRQPAGERATDADRDYQRLCISRSAGDFELSGGTARGGDVPAGRDIWPRPCPLRGLQAGPAGAIRLTRGHDRLSDRRSRGSRTGPTGPASRVSSSRFERGRSVC